LNFPSAFALALPSRCLSNATLRAIQAVLEAQHGRKLSLDALPRVLADRSAV
jgi:hypothetical protein